MLFFRRREGRGGREGENEGGREGRKKSRKKERTKKEQTKEIRQGRRRTSLLQSIRIFSKPIVRALCLHMGGGGGGGAGVQSCQLASKHTHLFDASDASILFENGGGGWGAPPTPPLFFESACFRVSNFFETSTAKIIDLQPPGTQKCCFLQCFKPLKVQKCCYLQYLQPLETQKCCNVQYFQPLKAQNCCYIQYLQHLWKLRNAAIFSSSGINAVFFRYLELANGQKCCISERLQPPLRLKQAFEVFSKLLSDPKSVFLDPPINKIFLNDSVDALPFRFQ